MKTPTAKDELYVVIEQMGNCKICGQWKDLRFGACFTCSDQVDGEKISEATHKLWDARNPLNVWYYSETRH